MKNNTHSEPKDTVVSDHLMTPDKHRIHYDWYRRGHAKVIVIAPGFYNSKKSPLLKDFAGTLNDHYDVMVMDFRGHGQSSGLFYWTSKEYLDLMAVLEFARNQYRDIGVVGFSLGGSTSIITASKTDLIKSLICVSAPAELFKVDYHLWQLDIENDVWFGLLSKESQGKGVWPGPFWHKKEKPLDLVGGLQIPILYIHGDKDWLVKLWHSEKLFGETKSLKKLVVIKNGPHAEYLIRKNKVETVRLVREWFRDTL